MADAVQDDSAPVILVLGATGSCGRHFVDHAVHAGFNVRCLLRDPARVRSDPAFHWASHAHVEMRQGNLTDQQSVADACAGVAAVISMVGPTKDAKISDLPATVRNVVAGMRQHGVRRLIVQCGGFTKLEGEPTLGEQAMRKMFVLATGEGAMIAGNDEAAHFLHKECGDIDWTVARPGMLDERAASGHVEADHDYGAGMPGATLGKIDLTRWYLDLITDQKSFRKAPAPCYAAEDFDFAAERVGTGQKRVAVITGANSGLGFETCRVLLSKGMRVIIACRSEEKGQAAVAELLVKTAGRPDPADSDAVFESLDVSSLGSVRTFAHKLLASDMPVHVLVCNAGIMMGPRRTSVDGIELQLATNYLGHFELCRLLQERLVASAPARIVHVSSMAARFASLDPKHLDRGEDGYSSQDVYGMSKLAQIVFSRELNRRLQGRGVTSNSLEPGVVATNLSLGITDDAVMQKRLEGGVSVSQGARTQTFLAASMRMNGVGAGHWQDCRDISKGLGKLKYLLAAHSLRGSMDEALWMASEALVAKHSPS
jgi:retinol dehydrogenase-12